MCPRTPLELVGDRWEPTDAHNCHLIHNNIIKNIKLKLWKLNYNARNKQYKIHQSTRF